MIRLRAISFLIRKVKDRFFIKNLSRKMMISSESMEIETGMLTKVESIELLKYMTPTLSWKSHKGESGRIGVIGGCREYTGAPYFAAMSALRLGCDLSHVFCTTDAAIVIKSYSPELIVHPLLDAQGAVDKISPWLPRLHTIVIGPGLGRDKHLEDTVLGVLEAAIALNIPIVIDADGIFYISQHPDKIRGQRKITLTPNAVEFERLYTSLLNKELPKDDLAAAVYDLSNHLQGVCIVCKGKEDIISNGTKILACTNTGSPRRCGGQGDLLSGTTGVWQYWAHKVNKIASTNIHYDMYGAVLCGAYAGCWLTKQCNAQAFEHYKRATLTTDMLEQIGPVMSKYIDEN